MSENETTEYKKTLGQLKEGIISIAAILNKHGEGELWFGIRDDGAPVGVNVGEKTVRDISQAIAAHIEPKIYPEITTVTRENAQCIRVRFSGAETPYFAYGRAYMRVADEDRQLSKQEQEKLILDKNRSAFRWDNEPCKASPNDLDEARVKGFVERAGLSWDSLPNTLEKLDLLVDDTLLNTAPLFFGKKPVAKLRCAVFGTTSTSFIIDRQDFDGGILELIEEAQKYVLKNIHIGMRLEGLYRVDVPEIATPAIREAIINAFCHRDYRDPQEVQVAIFKDRVEIRNPGTLFGGLTFENLRSGKFVRRRNPLIVHMLTRIQLVEAWGRGMGLILENEPDTRFEEVAGMFITTFTRPSLTGGGKGETGPVKGDGIEVVSSPTNTTTITTTISLSAAEKAIIEMVGQHPTITLKELAERLGQTRDGIRYHTDKLKTKGLLRRIGTKNGRWEIVQTTQTSKSKA
jgi:Predicted transcriptional regulator containing an HTH domain and an uncharacterized domain shared with the mammalian protein Schlafen